jgi:hypothetical protein
MVDITSPLKYHMNDLVYDLGRASGGNLGRQISYLGAIAAMGKGMLYPFNSDSETDKEIQAELDEFILLVDMLDKAYNPLIDTNPYLFQKARRVRKGVHTVEVLAYHIISRHNLVTGNIMRSRLVDQFGKDRIKTMPEDYNEIR